MEVKGLTKSESLFEDFCNSMSVIFKKIPVGLQKAPDYFIYSNDLVCIAEIKQIEHNKEELAIINTDPAIVGEYEATYGTVAGERIREKLKAGMRQIKGEFSNYPAIIIIYNNTLWPEYTSGDYILNALYGIEAILVSSEAAPEGGAKILNRWFAHNRMATPNHNTSLSAVGILEIQNMKISLTVYHNYFASRPFPLNVFAKKLATHYHLSNNPQLGYATWSEIN